jgi:ribonuclease J
MRLSFPERRPAVIGIVSILIIAAGTTLAFSVNRFQGLRGVYEVSADLTDAAGLQSGNEVRIAGVKVGRVTKVRLTDDAARVTMEIASDIRIPQETTLEVKLKTLLGQKFINLRFPKAYRGRVVTTSFASNIHRVQQVIDAAAQNGRKVCLVGRSMRKNVNIGRSLGHISAPEGILIQPRELEQFPDDRIVVISTGSQGEPLSALRRMAYRDHPAVELKEGDTVVFSATPIPGNERAVNEVIDRLYRVGCDVVTARDAPIHASGHGYQEELKLMLNLTHPRYLMPVHGDFKRMRLHGQLAEAVGMPHDHIFRGENGLPLEIDAKGARWAEHETSGMVFVDGVDIGDVADVAMRDRRMLSADGILVLVATVSEQDGSSVVAPEVIARGVPFLDDKGAVLDEIRDAVEDSLDRSAEQRIVEIDVLEQRLHDDIAAFIYNRLKRRPMVLPVVVEV